VDPDTGVIAVAAEVEEGQSLLFAIREPEAGPRRRRADGQRARRRRPPGGYQLRALLQLPRARALALRPGGVDAGSSPATSRTFPILGFFCNAEIAPVSGMNHLFTYTGVLVLFSA
jgi:small ligand-binding sensory domain FIST